MSIVILAQAGFGEIVCLIVSIIAMASIVRVSEQFSAGHLGNGLAQLWNINGLTLRLHPMVDAHGNGSQCPITCGRITNQP